MDIYGAEIQVQKLLNYVKGLSQSEKTLYQKSKVRLKDLATNCSQIVSIISEILQEEALNTEPPEFEGTDTSDFNSVIKSMEDQIQELRDFLNLSPGYHSPNSSSSSTLVDDSATPRKQAMLNYKSCLQQLANTSMDVKEAEDCSNLLWKWFYERFLNSPSDFRYNMKHIPRWIRDIVIVYGYHVSRNTVDSFKHEFYTWMSMIPHGNKYVVPLEVYNLEKAVNPSMMTLTAAVLWDVLLDNGLRDLCRDSSSEFYLTEDCVFTFIGEHNSDAMNKYENYSYDYTLLERCNLTIKAGDEK